MVFENEITVEVDCSIEKLREILTKNNLKKQEEYDLIDFYLIRKDYDTNLNVLDILKQCVLIRHVVEENKETKLIIYKYKEYDENDDILKQGKIKCKIDSIDDAQKIFEVLGYTKLIEIKDHITVYSNDTTEFAVQEVNNKHIYIEIESNCNFINKVYSDIDEMKNEISKYQIPIKNSDYFVKKAAIELNESCK